MKRLIISDLLRINNYTIIYILRKTIRKPDDIKISRHVK